MKKTKLTLLMVLIFILSLTSSVLAAENSSPKIDAKAAITMDIKTGEIIYSNNVDAKMYPASTTKLLTGLLLAQNKTKTDVLKYTDAAKKDPDASLHILRSIPVGDGFSAEAAMDGLLIFSANDMATMIADGISGDTTKFSVLMNDTVKKLGLKNTHFVTPNGLHDPEHYTTAYDLGVISREAFKNDWVKETLAKKKSKVTTSSNLIFSMDNRNILLGKDGNVGGKTGYTSQAGRCLVAFYERDGRQLLGIVMKGSGDASTTNTKVFKDMQSIVDYSYNAKPVVLFAKGSALKTQDVSYKPFGFFGPTKTIAVPLVANEDIYQYDNDVNKKETNQSYSLKKFSAFSLSKDKSVGTVTINEREAKKTYDVYTSISTGDIVKANMFLYIGTITALIFIIVVVLLVVLKIKNASRKRRRY